ncbi:hypothetical protein LV75_005990 [Actinokineospora diospyrosa]|uniref:Uncharacterized protein n=1 Tax=Actinokineospora diospyrosa TaxID=103728 RepID=A0ABT1ILD6_9PSEU|nr:hypothetical protein [Actinokineospora diospyrosa]
MLALMFAQERLLLRVVGSVGGRSQDWSFTGLVVHRVVVHSGASCPQGAAEAPILSGCVGKLCIWGLSIRLILTRARVGDAGQGIRASAFGSGKRLAFGIASDPRFSSFARCGGPVLRGAPTTPDAEPQSRGPKAGPAARTTLRVPSPHTKQVHPIEHLAPATPTVQALSRWAGADLTAAGLAPQGPTVQVLGRWVGADLTGGELAPQGPSVQVLGWQGRRGRAGMAPPGPSVQGRMGGCQVVVHNAFCCAQA